MHIKRVNFLRNVTEKAGLFAEPLPGVPFVEICGDDRLLIENHDCILGYTDSEIHVRVSFGLIMVRGNKLEIFCVKKDQLVVQGKICEVILKR